MFFREVSADCQKKAIAFATAVKGALTDSVTGELKTDMSSSDSKFLVENVVAVKENYSTIREELYKIREDYKTSAKARNAIVSSMSEEERQIYAQQPMLKALLGL